VNEKGEKVRKKGREGRRSSAPTIGLAVCSENEKKGKKKRLGKRRKRRPNFVRFYPR